MKTTTLLLAFIILSMTGCSKTWSGMKQDTNEALDSTRDAIHEATAPGHVSTETIAPLPTVIAPAAVVATEQATTLK